MHDVLVSVGAFIVLIGILVVVHEFGHFIVAKLCGVRVEAFSIGFGPRLFGIKHGETDYKVCAFPLGGYVKMTGETPDHLSESTDENPREPGHDPKAFTSHPRWQRMLIGVAGPVANFILAFVVMLANYSMFNEVPKNTLDTTTIEWVTPDSPAANAGLQSGDIIRSFEKTQNPTWDDVFATTQLNPNKTLPIIVERAGQSLQLSIHLPASGADPDNFDIGNTGIYPQLVQGPIGIQQVQSNTPAEQAGLRAGDAIQSVDGHAFHMISTMIGYLQTGKGKPITLAVLRNGTPLTLEVHPAKIDGSSWKIGFQAPPLPLRKNPLAFAGAVSKASSFLIKNGVLNAVVFQRMFTHQVAVSQLSGPVGIARVAGDVAETRGWSPKLTLTAQISVGLGILNLLPFPILDGGLILFLIIESLLRRDISANVKERIYQAAFVVIMLFFAFVMFNDVSKLPVFSHHLKP